MYPHRRAAIVRANIDRSPDDVGKGDHFFFDVGGVLAFVFQRFVFG